MQLVANEVNPTNIPPYARKYSTVAKKGVYQYLSIKLSYPLWHD
jgi:hypothetical protein